LGDSVVEMVVMATSGGRNDLVTPGITLDFIYAHCLDEDVVCCCIDGPEVDTTTSCVAVWLTDNTVPCLCLYRRLSSAFESHIYLLLIFAAKLCRLSYIVQCKFCAVFCMQASATSDLSGCMSSLLNTGWNRKEAVSYCESKGVTYFAR